MVLGHHNGRKINILVNHFSMNSQGDNKFTNYFVVNMPKQMPVLRQSTMHGASFPTAMTYVSAGGNPATIEILHK
jgi:hypothetical protein